MVEVTQAEAITLEPCPFCGGVAKVSTYRTQSLFSSDEVEWTKVGCNDCDVAFNSEPDYDVSAIAAWNTRHRTEAVAALEADNAAHVRNTLDGYKVADELAAERDALEARVRELEGLLGGRDSFIVAQGLWNAFVYHLPPHDPR